MVNSATSLCHGNLDHSSVYITDRRMRPVGGCFNVKAMTRRKQTAIIRKGRNCAASLINELRTCKSYNNFAHSLYARYVNSAHVCCVPLYHVWYRTSIETRLTAVVAWKLCHTTAAIFSVVLLLYVLSLECILNTRPIYVYTYAWTTKMLKAKIKFGHNHN